MKASHPGCGYYQLTMMWPWTPVFKGQKEGIPSAWLRHSISLTHLIKDLNPK
jgi:hypothetical protein